MFKKGFSKILILVIVLVVLVGVSLILTFLRKPTALPDDSAIFSDLIIGDQGETDQPATDETADWQTYRNEEYGFEMKYPEEYSVQDPLGPAQIKIGKITIYITPEFALFRIGAGGYLPYDVLSENFPQNIFLEDILINKVSFRNDYYVGYGGMGSWDSGINAFTLDTYNGNYYIISLYSIGFEDTPPEAMLNTTNGVCRDNCLTDEAKDWLGVQMKEGIKDETKIFHQMLSTFRLLN